MAKRPSKAPRVVSAKQPPTPIEESWDDEDTPVIQAPVKAEPEPKPVQPVKPKKQDKVPAKFRKLQ